ncbi:MAG: radical SAM protein [Alphaproteobacteria bacterium]|nr:radical SAM protein [Alphaproteobacteria bacterium]
MNGPPRDSSGADTTATGTGPTVRALRGKQLRQRILDGIRDGHPTVGPSNVHIDITNGCNAACITCWDHSPLLATPRSTDWKRRRMSRDRFHAICDQLAALGSVRAVVVSGMGEPLTHPDVYDLLARVKAEGWHLTVLTNLVAADLDRLVDVGVDNLLVGVHGASPDAYLAFHPGWTEQHYFRMCRSLRTLVRAGVRVRHVQVIDRNTAPELVEMVRFGQLFQADRVNYKLASLADGTEQTVATTDQLRWLADRAIPDARALAAELGVPTNLDLFTAQVDAALRGQLVTTDMVEIGCHMGHVYTRITVDGELLYCCNTALPVGHLDDGPLVDQWWGPRWQALRDRIAQAADLPGCERCGKVEQNRKWAARLADGA